jgi:hypothetical protein
MAMVLEEGQRQALKAAIGRRLAWHAAAFDPVAQPRNRLPQLAALRAWQSRRLRESFTDVLADPRMRPAGEFFLSDLYSERDFSRRDQDIARILPLMVHLLPVSLLQAARDALELHVLSHALDMAMAAALASMPGGRSAALTVSRYSQAYRQVGQARLRAHQIGLIVRVGQSLDAAVQRHGVYRILRASRLPAKAAGLGELQGFLERGFHAFDALGGAEAFLARIETGERAASARLFAGDPDPFRRGA